MYVSLNAETSSTLAAHTPAAEAEQVDAQINRILAELAGFSADKQAWAARHIAERSQVESVRTEIHTRLLGELVGPLTSIRRFVATASASVDDKHDCMRAVEALSAFAAQLAAQLEDAAPDADDTTADIGIALHQSQRAASAASQTGERNVVITELPGSQKVAVPAHVLKRLLSSMLLSAQALARVDRPIMLGAHDDGSSVNIRIRFVPSGRRTTQPDYFDLLAEYFTGFGKDWGLAVRCEKDAPSGENAWTIRVPVAA